MIAVVTIRDIARAAGCSKSTVARALQNSELCSADTRIRVKNVAERLGYRMNPGLIARMAYVSSRGRRPGPGLSLAYLTDMERGAFRSDRVAQAGFLAAKARAEELACRLDLLSYDGSRDSLARLHRVLRHRGIHGVVLAAHTHPQIDLALDWSEFAVVCVGFSIRSPRFDRVGFNHYGALLDTCERAREKGFHRIALAMSADSDARIMHLARAAFLRWQTDCGAPVLPVLVSPPGRPGDIAAWYRKCRPDCILLYGEVKSLAEAGIFAGKNVAVATPLLNERQPEFGGFNIQLRDLSSMSIDMLLAKLSRNERGIPTMRQTLLIEAQWVDGPAAFQRSGGGETRKKTAAKK